MVIKEDFVQDASEDTVDEQLPVKMEGKFGVSWGLFKPHPFVQAVGRITEDEDQRSKQALMEILAAVRKAPIKHSMLVFRGRRLKHPDRSVAIFVAGMPYEDYRFLSGMNKEVPIRVIPEPIQICGGGEGSLGEAVKRSLEKSRQGLEDMSIRRKQLAPGSGIAHICKARLSGTLGLILKSKDPEDDNYYGLTCAHVVDPLAAHLPDYKSGEGSVPRTTHPLAGETLIVTPLWYNEEIVVEDLRENSEWQAHTLLERRKLLNIGLSELAYDFKALHVGSRVRSQSGSFKRRDGSMGVIDIGIIKLSKDRVDPDNPNGAFYRGSQVQPSPAPPLTFGTFNDAASGTSYGLYGAVNALSGRGDSGVIHDTEPLYLFYNREGQIEEITMRAIMTRLTFSNNLCSSGDSGAIVFDGNTHRIIGMVMGRLDSLTLIMTIDDILENIGSEYVIA